MRLALLKGNRFNPWHLQPFAMLPDTEVVAFRAESEIQRYFQERGSDALPFPVERIHFDTQTGALPGRLWRGLLTRYRNRTPRIVPFAERLAGFDVIQTWELFTDWTEQALEARKRYGIPVAVMVWDLIPFNLEREPGRRARKQRAAAEADAFIVHTERSRRALLLEGVDPDRVHLVHPGVDTDTFTAGPADRRGFAVEDGEFVILFVGWFLPRKGLDYLVLALRELINDADLTNVRFRLLMVGSGPGRDRIEALIERVGVREQCTFAGSMPYARMPEAYRAADVFVLPSIATPEWQEQFGMALMEAMACGRPVVTTMSGAIPEIAGLTAVLCQPNDFVALHDALKGLVLQPDACEALGKAARERATNRFTQAAYAHKLAEVYRALTEKGV